MKLQISSRTSIFGHYLKSSDRALPGRCKAPPSANSSGQKEGTIIIITATNVSSLSPTRDLPRAAELLRKARSQFTFTSEEKKTFKRAQQQHVLVDGYIEKQRREIVADCSCADISSDHNIIFLLLILEKVLCAISLHISLHCSLVASRRRPNWFRYESYCSCWPETRNILILNVSIWPRTNERKKSANIDCGTWNLSPDLLRSLSSWSVLFTRPL